ncbi:MAG: DEAD/DEAH box helicase [Rhodoferax sp.]
MAPTRDLWFDPRPLEKRCSAATWQRAVLLWRGHKVLSLEIEPEAGHWVLLGEVQGTEAEPYETSAELRLDAQGQLQSWEGDCSCPVGVNCKHAVALTLQAAYQGRSLLHTQSTTIPAPQDELQARQASEQRAAQMRSIQSENQLLQWLHQVASAQQGASVSSTGETRSEQYLYLLRPEGSSTAQPRLRLDLCTSTQSKKGDGWNKPKAVRYPQGLGDAAYTGAAPSERELLEWLRATAVGGSGYHYGGEPYGGVLRGQLATLVLEAASRTGRLHTVASGGYPGPALRWGEPRPLHWHWVQRHNPGETEERWQLQAQVDGARTQLCFNEPPLYLDLERNLCGPAVSADLGAAVLSALLKAPALGGTALRKHQARIQALLGPVPLPPSLQAIDTLEGVAPQPCLLLRAHKPGDVPHHGLVQAELRFDYAGYRGWWSGAGTAVVVDGPQGQRLLQRDPEAEFDAMSSLLELGLHPDGADGHFGIPGHQSQQTWLQWADSDFAPLRQAGFDVSLDDSLQHWITHADAVQVALDAVADSDSGSGTSDWFDLSLGIEVQGQRRNLLPWLPELIAVAAQAPRDTDSGQPQMPPYVYLSQEGGGFLRLPTEALAPWMAALLELVGERPSAFGAEHLRLSRLEALRATASLGEGAVWDGAQALRDTVRTLSGAGQLPAVAIPASVHATLRPYQLQGVAWLQFLRTAGLGGILADDMGLGKTLQTLAHLQIEKDAGRLQHPALIVAPVSLMGNWAREAARFCPQLRTLVLHGKERHEAASAMAETDLVIAPYSLMQRDKERWLAQPWSVVVLDEAHHIKNAHTHAAQVVGQLQAGQRVCLSGTPMENHLGELWSLFHFLMPGFLGSQARFTQLFRTPIEKQNDLERMAQLRARVTPFMLRRTKALVATELPPKVQTVVRVELSPKQADLYETIRLGMEQTVREALASKGLAKSHITILDALLKLRQVCCDPRLLSLQSAKKVQESAKLDQLADMLEEMVAEGRRVLVFSQFTTMLGLIEDRLKDAALTWTKLTGQTQKRDEAIARFTSGAVPIFLISLKAGGVGLNLPQADTVIHYDPWWNPAAQAQATDRAHRIGQTGTVFEYQLVAQGTIEERILALQDRKADLSERLLREASARNEPLFSEGDIAELFKPLA